jgi:hypothetical protein
MSLPAYLGDVAGAIARQDGACVVFLTLACCVRGTGRPAAAAQARRAAPKTHASAFSLTNSLTPKNPPQAALCATCWTFGMAPPWQR